MDRGEAAPQAAQLRADALPLIAQAMTFEAQRLLDVEENFPPLSGIARPAEHGFGKLLMLGQGASPAEAYVKLDGRFARFSPEPHHELVASRRERGHKAVRIDLKTARLFAAIERLAVQPDLQSATRGSEKLDLGLLGDVDLGSHLEPLVGTGSAGRQHNAAFEAPS